ncbi:hypothetical protein [Pedobacter heparinus]|uniref:hypothetical protein n=1 Tax=Pedobacter heparinus TaxID=984 RepID=UPI00292FED8D|nr:hypothetical protein [Pedobacter heparinus]
MEMSTALYQAALVTHVAGITIMAGTTFIDYITFRIFCGSYQSDQAKGIVLESLLNKLQRYMGIGMLVILVSGVMMMIKLHEVWGAQLWFRTKIGILLIIIINGLGLRRIAGSKLKKAIINNSSTTLQPEVFNRIRRNFTAIQLIQLLLFIIIFVLSIFKFN